VHVLLLLQLDQRLGELAHFHVSLHPQHVILVLAFARVFLIEFVKVFLDEAIYFLGQGDHFTLVLEGLQSVKQLALVNQDVHPLMFNILWLQVLHIDLSDVF